MSKQIVPDQPGVRVGATPKTATQFTPVKEPDSFGQLLRAWLTNHKASFVDSVVRLARQPLGSFFTWLVMAVALSLPMGLSLLLDSTNQLGGSWQQAAEISVFMEIKSSETQAQKLQQTIQALPAVAQVELISPNQALAEFQELSGLGNAITELPKNPLPYSLLITPKQVDKQQLEALKEQLAGMPYVEVAQLDMQWVERLSAMLRVGKQFIFGLALLLIAALLLVIGNTIRLHIENRRTEIEVTKLVGGTDGYVRRPFLYMGVLYGLGGGLLAWLILAFILESLNHSVTDLAQLYGSDFALRGVPLADGIYLVLGAMMLGYIGAWLAVARHLRELAPR